MKFKIAIIFLVLLTAYSAWRTRPTELDQQVLLSIEPEGIMGTSCRIAIIVDRKQEDYGHELLMQAERELRRQESIFSVWVDRSELSVLNDLNVGSTVELSSDLAFVLLGAKDVYDASGGLFDVCARPLISLWKNSAKQGITPTQEEILAARSRSDWSMLRVEDNILTKNEKVELDLNALAKGYSIDKALEKLEQESVFAAMVDVGGDIKTFGQGPSDTAWSVYLKDPYSENLKLKLSIRDRAVCTSGDYARFVEIDGKHYSHIINPKSGYPVEKSSSVTVVGESAMLVDAWATALSVLGVEGLALLPNSYEAMMIIGTRDDFIVKQTEGFTFLLEN